MDSLKESIWLTTAVCPVKGKGASSLPASIHGWEFIWPNRLNPSDINFLSWGSLDAIVNPVNSSDNWSVISDLGVNEFEISDLNEKGTVCSFSFGFNSLNELKQIVNYKQKNITHNYKYFSSLNKKLIDPRKWKKEKY